MLKGHIICNYDELSENIDVNKILKTMLAYLTNLKDIDYTVKKEINKTLLNFSTIDQYNIHKIKWDQVRYDNNTYRYKNLIDLCRWVYNEKQYENNYEKLGQPERVYMLFKSSVYNIIKHQFGDIDLVESYNIPYILDNEPMFEKYMFNSQPATTIQIKGLTLIIMVKLSDNIYYNNDFNIDNKKMNELLMCVRAYETEYKRNQVGVYIQVNLQQEGYSVDPMITQMLDRVTLGNITIDLWDKWEFLLNRVSSPYNYFIQRKKNKDSR